MGEEKVTVEEKPKLAHEANEVCPGEHGVLDKCQPSGMYIGGELHVIADPKTGKVSVSAPDNIIVAMGLIELGRMALHNRQNAEQLKHRPAPPAIIPATPGMVGQVAKAAAGLKG